jgi:hypothetical protein
MGAEFRKVFARWVAFMLGKTILRVEPIALEHDAVTLDFGNNAGRRDAEAYAIAADQRGLRAWEMGDWQAVDECVNRAGQKLFDYCTHPGMRGAEDVQAVDFLRGDYDAGPANFGTGRNLGIESFARFGGKFFGVIEAAQNKILWKNDCAYNDRSSERSTTGFVDTCDRIKAQVRKSLLMNQGTRH